LLEDPGMAWDRAVLSTWGQNNHSVRDARWRYTRYADGAEELYDHDNDPNECTNLAGDAALTPVKERLSAYFPVVNVEPWTGANADPGAATPPPRTP